MSSESLLELHPSLLPAGSTLLHTAASSGNTQACRIILDNSTENLLESFDHRNWTPLSVALHSGRLEVSRLLLEYGASTSANFTRDLSIRDILEGYECIGFVQSLVEGEIGIGRFTPTLVYHSAAFDGNALVLDKCISLYSVDVNHTDCLGRTALHDAVFNSHFECIDVLMRHGASVTIYDSANFSPLHHACQQGKEAIVEKILEEYDSTEIGHILDTPGHCGRTPLHLALEYHRYSIASLLLKQFPLQNLNVADNCSVTPHDLLYQAYLQPDMPLGMEFFLAVAHLLHQDFKDALLHQAIFDDRADHVRKMIDSGANIERFDASQSHNSLLLASRLGRVDIVQILLEEGANVRATDLTLQTPLHLAARYGHQETVQFLLNDTSTPLHAADRNSYTAFEYALQNQHRPVVDIFLNFYQLTSNPMPLSSKKRVLDLLAHWAGGDILSQIESVLGDVFAVLESQETSLPQPADAANMTPVPLDPAMSQSLCSSMNGASSKLLALKRAKRLPEGALRRYKICFYCLGLQWFPDHHAYTCREKRRSDLLEEHCCSPPHSGVYQRNRKILQFYEQQLSSPPKEPSKDASTSGASSKNQRIVAKQRAIWKRLCSKVRNRHRKTCVYNYYPLHTAVCARNTAFLEWILLRADSTEQQKTLLLSKNGSDRSLIEVIVSQEMETAVSPLTGNHTFTELIQQAKQKLQPKPSKSSAEPSFRRTWSMRVHHDVKTTTERAMEIVNKKKAGRKMRCTDSDYTLLCHILYHNPHLSKADGSIIMDMLISRSKIAGTRTLPCNCRCTRYSNTLNLHPAVTFILKCYKEGVDPDKLKSIVRHLCRHVYFSDEVQWKESQSMPSTPHQLQDWWCVLCSMDREDVDNLLMAVCMFGDEDQAAILLPWCPENALLTENDKGQTALEYVVKRKQAKLLKFLFEDTQVVGECDYAKLLPLCCADLRAIPGNVVSRRHPNKKVAKLEPYVTLNKDYKQRKLEVLGILLERAQQSSSSIDLSKSLSTACTYGWWEGVARIFECGANPCASYTGRKHIKRYVFLEVLTSTNLDLFSRMLHSAVEVLGQDCHQPDEEADIVYAIVSYLPMMFGCGLYSEVQFILENVHGAGDALWSGSHPMACRLAALYRFNDIECPLFPLPSSIGEHHLKVIAKYGLSDCLRAALRSTDVPEDVFYSDLIHWAASSGDCSTLEAVYECLESYHCRLVEECESSQASRAVSTPWTDSESLFWSTALFSAASCDHQTLAIKAIDKIVSSPSRKKSLTRIRNNSLTVLHWACYWGMSELLSTTEGLTHENFVDAYNGPLTPLDCAIGTANLRHIADFITKPDLSLKLVESFYEFYDESDSEDDDSTMKGGIGQLCYTLIWSLQVEINGKQCSTEYSVAALLHLLTLGWFDRLMSANAEISPSGIHEGPSSSSTSNDLALCTESCFTTQPINHFLSKILTSFLVSVFDGNHRSISFHLSGLRLPGLKEELLTVLVEVGNLPIPQLAALSQSVEMITVLLDCLPSVAVRRKLVNHSSSLHCNSALQVATSFRAAGCVSKLLSAGANLKVRNKNSQNVLHLAVASCSFDTVDVILQQKTSSVLIFDKDAFGDTPMSTAIQCGQFEMVEAMRAKVPAKRWNEEIGQKYAGMCHGWFRYFMQQNHTKWKDSSFSTKPTGSYNLRESENGPSLLAGAAAVCNHPYILYAIVHVSGEAVVAQICDKDEHYSEALAEVALQKKNLFLPHIDEYKLMKSVRAGHEEATVALMKEKMQTNPFFLSESLLPQEKNVEEVFTCACLIGSQRLINCLMDFGILHNYSNDQLVEWFDILLQKGHINLAASFLLQTDLSPHFNTSNVYHSPLLLSIFDPKFNIAEYFSPSQFLRGTRKALNKFSLQEAWLSYTWTPDLLKVAQRNPSLGKVAELRQEESVRLFMSKKDTVEVRFDWRAFDEVARCVAKDCSRLQHCPVLTECMVLSGLVMHHVAHIWKQTRDNVPSGDMRVTVVMDDESAPGIIYSLDCQITLKYSSVDHTLVFPDLTLPSSPIESMLSPSELVLSEVISGLAATGVHSLPLSGPDEFTSIEVQDLEELWTEHVDQRELILSGIVSLFNQVDDVLFTILSSSYKLFSERAEGSTLCSESRDFRRHKVMYYSLVSVIRPVLKAIECVHFNITYSSTSSNAVCSLDSNALEFSISLSWTQQEGGLWFLELPSKDVMLESLSSCLLLTRSQQLVNWLVGKLCRGLRCSMIDNNSLSVILPDERHLGDVDEPPVQAAVLQWLVSGKSGLFLFLDLVQMLGRSSALYSDLRDYLFSGLRIEVHTSHSPALTSFRGWLTLSLSMDEQQDAIHTLHQSLCSFGRLNVSKRMLANEFNSYVFPSQCRVVGGPPWSLHYSTTGTTQLTVELCDYNGDPVASGCENLHRVQVGVLRCNLRICECVWASNVADCVVHGSGLEIKKENHCSFTVTWNYDTKKAIPGLYTFKIKVNGEHIQQSPFKLFVGRMFNSRLVETASRPSLPLKYLHHNEERINRLFLPQSHTGATVCGADRPLVFHLSHGQHPCCRGNVKADVPARIRKTDSGIIVRVPISYSRQSSISGTSPTPHPTQEAGDLAPIHHLTMCAQRRGFKNWISYEAGPVQVLMQPKFKRVTEEVSLSKWRKRVRVHCLQLGAGEYRLAIVQSCCGMFLLMASCASCHSVLSVHADTSRTGDTAPLQVMCTILPGLISPQQTLIAATVEGLSNKRGRRETRERVVTIVEVGSEASFYFQFVDLYRNCITAKTGLDEYPVMILGAGLRPAGGRGRPTDLQCQVTSVGLGVFQATFTAYTTGIHSIAVGQHPLSSKVMATVITPDPTRTVCSNWQREMLGCPWSCTVELYDKYGNPVKEAKHPVVAQYSVDETLRRATITKIPGTNKCQVSVECSRAGAYEVNIFVESTLIPNMPLRFTAVITTSEKFKQLRNSLMRNWCRGSTPTLTMVRSNLLESAINQLTDDVLRHQVRVRFDDEVGIDAGGVSREFFELLGESLVNPNYALFEEIGGLFRPNPNSSINPNHLFYFKFAGKILAKAIADGHRLSIRFTPAVYKFLCERTCTVEDLRTEDPALYSGLQQIMKCSSEDELKLFGLNFTAQSSRFGSVVVTELEPGGQGQEVTLINKDLYIFKVVEYHLTECVREQLEELKAGFNMLIPQGLLAPFTADELEMIISGVRMMDVDLLQSRTTYIGYSKTSSVVQWLWETLREYPEDMKGKFLSFSTGSSCLPANFMHWHFEIYCTHSTGQLPTAATCSNRLILPNYSSKKELEEKLKMAISMGIHSFHLY